MEPFSPRPRLSVTDRIFQFFENKPASDRFFLKLSAAVLFGAILYYIITVNDSVVTNVPSTGGTLTEGIVGTPAFINPVLAITRADRDVTALVYSSLMDVDPAGEIVPEAAESLTVSEDGTVYTLQLKSGLTFHDGEALTTDDVAFTIGLIKEPNVRSPWIANFDGVFVEVIDDTTIQFVLEEPFAPFIENLTFGILPRHIWQNIPIEQLSFSQNNTEPIGSGPYRVDQVTRNNSGFIEAYELEAFADITGRPRIDRVHLTFYPNEQAALEALANGEIMSISGLTTDSVLKLTETERAQLVSEPLPRTFALFFNQNKSNILLDPAVREALDVAIDRNRLTEEVFNGLATPLTSPIPPGFGPDLTATSTSTSTPLTQATTILEDGGWKRQEDGSWSKEIDELETTLTVDVATANSEVFNATAEFIRAEWEALGVVVSVRQFEQTDLTQAVIRPRDYQILLFGTVVGRQLDFYSFWHSSGRTDPGLNVALYANITTDEVLENLRTETDPLARDTLLRTFVTELSTETPAAFLFAPEFTYLLPESVSHTNFTRITHPSERFSNISDWHMSTDSLWPIFK